MKYIISFFASVFLISGITVADDKADISAVLDQLHDNAATASWDAYFDLYAKDAIFLGTDVSERWEKSVFQSYASQTKGWVYIKRERHIGLTPDGNSAWFDEVLDSKNYGTSRGTGVVIRTPNGWKILQYNLTFPIPNDLAAGITQQIQTFEAHQK
jgi:hypothetical protein